MTQPWGLSGPQFLTVYMIAIFVAAALPRLLSWTLRWVPGPPGTGRTPGPYEIAYLRGGPGRVAQVALTELTSCGALRVSSKGRVRVASPERWARTEAARYGILPEGFPDEMRTSSAAGRIRKSPAISQIVRDLRAEGFLLSGAQAAAVRTTAVVAVAALLGTGLARLIEGTSNHRPTADLKVLFFFAIILSLWMLLSGARAAARRPTRRGAAFAGPLARGGDARGSGTLLAVALYGLTAVPNANLRDALLAGMRSSSGGPGGAGGGCGGGGGGGGGCGGGGGGCGG